MAGPPPISGSPGPQPPASGPPGAPPGAISLSGLQSTLQQINLALTALTTAIENAFPQASQNTSPTATAGAGILPAAPVKFLDITISGTSYRIPLYNP